MATFAWLAAACGGSTGADSGVATLQSDDSTGDDVVAADSPTGDGDQEQAMLDFAACMRENGVDIEDPTVDSNGNVQFGGLQPEPGAEDGEFDRGAMQGAMEACQEKLEGVALGFGGRNEIDTTALEDTLVEYAACMRENGYEMDDPSFSTGSPGDRSDGGGGGGFGSIDRDDPDFVAAQEACQEVLGDSFAGGGGAVPGGGFGGPGGGGGSDQ